MFAAANPEIAMQHTNNNFNTDVERRHIVTDCLGVNDDNDLKKAKKRGMDGDIMNIPWHPYSCLHFSLSDEASNQYGQPRVYNDAIMFLSEQSPSETCSGES